MPPPPINGTNLLAPGHGEWGGSGHGERGGSGHGEGGGSGHGEGGESGPGSGATWIHLQATSHTPPSAVSQLSLPSMDFVQ